MASTTNFMNSSIFDVFVHRITATRSCSGSIQITFPPAPNAKKLEAGPNPLNAKYLAVMEKQVAALVRYARGRKDEALKLAKEAVDIELSLPAPSGPADPFKQAPEFYGEMLLDSGRNT